VRKRIAGGKDDGISGKTAIIIWTLVRTVFKKTVNARERSKRVRPDDPTFGVLPPLKTRPRKKTFIYPSEFAQLVACDLVPLEWRELYAVAAYLYLRPGELRALTFEHVDLVAGVVSVVMAFDEEAGESKPTKAERGQREVPIPPALVPLLTAMREPAKPTDPVAPLLARVAHNKRAIQFREHLKLAKVTRPRLLEDTATTVMVNFRSLRDSGITWEALEGTPVDRIQARAGHEHISTTIGYVKAVEDLKGRFGTPFGPLPETLLSNRPEIARGDSKPTKSRKNKGSLAPAAGLEWARNARLTSNSGGLEYG
jgi:integrase